MPGPQASTTPSPSRRSMAESLRENLEAIVVAFTLAFIFRAFIVEAFIIPTGSMAATLYGEQVTHTCSTCGYEYAHGAEKQGMMRDPTLRCPNCAATTDRIEPRDLQRPSSGDRILVHKWPFNIGGKHLGPRRWSPRRRPRRCGHPCPARRG